MLSYIPTDDITLMLMALSDNVHCWCHYNVVHTWDWIVHVGKSGTNGWIKIYSAAFMLLYYHIYFYMLLYYYLSHFYNLSIACWLVTVKSPCIFKTDGTLLFLSAENVLFHLLFMTHTSLLTYLIKWWIEHILTILLWDGWFEPKYPIVLK